MLRCQVDMHKKFWGHKFGFKVKIAFQPHISTLRRLAIKNVYKLDVILTKVLLDLIHYTTSDSILTRKIGFQKKKKKISFPKRDSFLILHLRKLQTLIFLKCVHAMWGCTYVTNSSKKRNCAKMQYQERNYSLLDIYAPGCVFYSEEGFLCICVHKPLVH